MCCMLDMHGTDKAISLRSIRAQSLMHDLHEAISQAPGTGEAKPIAVGHRWRPVGSGPPRVGGSGALSPFCWDEPGLPRRAGRAAGASGLVGLAKLAGQLERGEAGRQAWLAAGRGRRRPAAAGWLVKPLVTMISLDVPCFGRGPWAKLST